MEVSAMKRGKKSSNSVDPSAQGFVKSTYLIPKGMKENLRLVSFVKKIDEADIVREAIGEKLKALGFEKPTESPDLKELLGKYYKLKD
jgi:hypothetical protein